MWYLDQLGRIKFKAHQLRSASNGCQTTFPIGSGVQRILCWHSSGLFFLFPQFHWGNAKKIFIHVLFRNPTSHSADTHVTCRWHEKDSMRTTWNTSQKFAFESQSCIKPWNKTMLPVISIAIHTPAHTFLLSILAWTEFFNWCPFYQHGLR